MISRVPFCKLRCDFNYVAKYYFLPWALTLHPVYLIIPELACAFFLKAKEYTIYAGSPDMAHI